MIVNKSHFNISHKKLLTISIIFLFFVVFNFGSNTAKAGMFSNAMDSLKSFINKDKTENIIQKSSDEVVLKVGDISASKDIDMKFIAVSDAPTLKSSVGLLRADNEEEVAQNDTIAVYEVKSGDTIADVAKIYGVSKNTIIWANDLKGKTIKEGDVLIILPVSGVKYTVKKGDTLKSIAKKYKGDIENIADYNALGVNQELAIGDEIIIPDGEIVDEVPVKKVAPKVKKYLVSNTAGYYMRPLMGGIKTQGIHGHNAVDIGTPVGSSILAAADGTVLVAKNEGYNGGYGKMVIISHANGTQTVYGHMSNVMISTGEKVLQGQVIGVSGNSGKSTGPHLHFEIRGAENPF